MSNENHNFNPTAQKIAKWQDQCFLTDARMILAGLNKNNVKGYKNLIAFDASSDKTISKFTSLPDSEIFFKLNPAQMALLVPTIRFFVVHYKSDSSSTPGSLGEHTYDSSSELFLDDHTSPSQVKGIEKSFDGQGRAYGIGLKNFQYEFDGGDFATTEKSIKVKAEFLLTSFESLEKKQGKAKWLDILLRTPKVIPKSLEEQYKVSSMRDMLTACREPAIGRDEARSDDTLISNPAYKRIKARVGWAATDVQALVDLFDRDVKKPKAAQMKNMLQSMQLDLFLEMTNYNFNFENDGRVTMTVEYRASIEGTLREPSANIFYGLQQDIKNKAAAKDRKIAQIERQKEDYRQQAGTQLGATRDDNPDEDPPDNSNILSDRLAKLDLDITRINNEFTDIIEVWKYTHYNNFLGRMLQEGKIYNIEISKDSLLNWRLPDPDRATDEDASAQSSARQGIKIGDAEKSSEDYAKARAKSKKQGLAAILLKERINSVPANSSLSPIKVVQNKKNTTLACEIGALKKDISNLVGRARIRGAMRPPQGEGESARCAEYPRLNDASDHVIQFMFLGDIIDTIMGIHKQNSIRAGIPEDEHNLRVVTTTINDINPENKKNVSLNIADIPISLEEFAAFFRRKVINPRVSRYFVMDFIKDLMTELVYRALGNSCWERQDRVIPSFTYTVFNARRTPKRREPWIKPNEDGFFIRGKPTGPATSDKLRVQPLDIGPARVMNYFILHGSLRATALRQVNRKRDEKEGIYHFGLGLRRGILKEVNFISNKMLHANTARVLADGAAGIDQLFNKFDADVELYGCPLFRNGQYIYIDPSTMGVKSKIARMLGMGGYYNIYNVKGQLGRDGYKTTLKCKFNSSGICDDKRSVNEDVLEPLNAPQEPAALEDPDRNNYISDDDQAILNTVAAQFASGPSALQEFDDPSQPELSKLSQTEDGRTRLRHAKQQYDRERKRMFAEGKQSSNVYLKYQEDLGNWQKQKAEYDAQGQGYPTPKPEEPTSEIFALEQGAKASALESTFKPLIEEQQAIENQERIEDKMREGAGIPLNSDEGSDPYQ